MTIFAQRSAIRFSSQPIDVSITGPIKNGSVLIFDEKKGAFVVKDGSAGQPFVTGGVNLGGAGAEGFFAGKAGSVLQFKEVVGGSGINVICNDESVTITADIESGILSVPDNYRITIDNDNSGTDARFEIFTARSTMTAPLVVSPIVVSPVTSINLFTGNDLSTSRGFFRAIDDIDFIAAGFTEGMRIITDGTDEQDGQHQIDDVENAMVGGESWSTIFVRGLFTGPAAIDLGGPQPSTVITQHDLFVPAIDPGLPAPYLTTQRYKLQSTSLDFGLAGLNYLPGMILQIRGTDGDLWNGNFTIRSVVAKGGNPFLHSEILFEPTSPIPGPEGIVIEPDPLVPEITLTIEDFEGSTGFFVTEEGEVNATAGVFEEQVKSGDNTVNASEPTDFNDLTRKDYVDSLSFPRGKPVRYFHAFFK